MTLTINVPDGALENLAERARAEGRPVADLAAEIVVQHSGDDYDEEEFPLDEETIEAIRQGYADVDAGRTSSLEESRARLEAVLATHQRSRHE